MSDTLLKAVYPSVYAGLRDPADDVVGVAASALLPVVHALLEPPDLSSHSFFSADVAALTNLLWASLEDLDDITSSTHSIMQLLAEIVRHQAEVRGLEDASSSFSPPAATATSLAEAGAEAAKLAERVPRLFPFLSHPSSLVRRAALRTLDALTSLRSLAQAFLPAVVAQLTSHLFQRALLEDQVRKSLYLSPPTFPVNNIRRR